MSSSPATELVAAQGLALNPDATHPPFGWHVALPADGSWSVLDIHPATWQRAAERLVDDKLAGRRIRTAERKAVLRTVSDLVASCQQGGTVLSLIQVGFLSDGQPFTAGLHLAWYDSAPEQASLSTVRQAISRQGIVEEHDTPAGTVLLQRDFQSVVAPGPGQRVGLTSLQAFLPLADSTWTAIVATASAHPAITDVLHALLLDVAGSIGAVDDQAADGSATDGSSDQPPPPAPRYERVQTPDAPGIERGFGTLVTHRVDPDAPATEPQP